MGEVNNKKSALVPRLRFQTFLSEQAWVPRCLGEIARFSSGGTPSKDEPSYWNGNIPWISASSMYETRIVDSELKVTTSAIGNGTRIAPKGSLLVLVRGSMLFNRVPIGIAAVDVAFNQDVKALSISGDANSIFLLYQLIAASPEIPINETGIGAGKIETDVLAGLPIYLPSPNEQQKIADCLSSLDELITAETQKLDALKTHKKGLMQQLFPREGETAPRLRFPEFRKRGPWKSKTLSNIATIRSGSTPSRTEPTFYAGGTIPWVKTTDLNNDFIYRTEECITPAAKAKINPVGSVLVAMYGGFKQIGRTGYLMMPAATNQAISVLNADESEVLPIYLLTWMNARVEDWKKIASSSRKDPNITGTDVANFPIAYPSKEEQEKIADVVASLNDGITAQSRKIDSLKAHKAGLMQQLFPVLDEVPA